MYNTVGLEAQTVTHTFSLGLYLDLDFEKRCIVKFMARKNKFQTTMNGFRAL